MKAKSTNRVTFQSKLPENMIFAKLTNFFSQILLQLAHVKIVLVDNKMLIKLLISKFADK